MSSTFALLSWLADVTSSRRRPLGRAMPQTSASMCPDLTYFYFYRFEHVLVSLLFGEDIALWPRHTFQIGGLQFFVWLFAAPLDVAKLARLRALCSFHFVSEFPSIQLSPAPARLWHLYLGCQRHSVKDPRKNSGRVDICRCSRGGAAGNSCKKPWSTRTLATCRGWIVRDASVLSGISKIVLDSVVKYKDQWGVIWNRYSQPETVCAIESVPQYPFLHIWFPGMKSAPKRLSFLRKYHLISEIWYISFAFGRIGRVLFGRPDQGQEIIATLDSMLSSTSCMKLLLASRHRVPLGSGWIELGGEEWRPVECRIM